VHLQNYQSVTTKLFTQKLQPEHNILETQLLRMIKCIDEQVNMQES